jgi:hypothetical protein
MEAGLGPISSGRLIIGGRGNETPQPLPLRGTLEVRVSHRAFRNKSEFAAANRRCSSLFIKTGDTYDKRGESWGVAGC